MANNSHLFVKAPLWLARKAADQHRLPIDLQSWLDETGSLTKRLRAIYGRDFGVSVLFNRWRPAFIDECRLLGLPTARYQLVREVMLHAAGRPLVLARTILPERTIEIAHRNLSHLGNRPLGEVIFAYPDLERRQRQFSRAPTSNWAPALAEKVELREPVWGRRTVYAIHQQPLVVAEFFLPGLFWKG